MPGTSPFFRALFDQHESWRQCPLVEAVGDGWRGQTLIIPPPPGADLADMLRIEEVADEITIGLDHGHIHMSWPPRVNGAVDAVWLGPMVMIDAILSEAMVALSG